MSQSMAPSPDDHQNPERDPMWVAHNATDRHWHQLTGACGGCGSIHCHPGPCPQNSNGYCMACPTRRETGEVRGAR